MTDVVFLPPAEEEMIAAARYYESQSPGLGSAFLDEVEQATNGLAAHPQAAPVVRNGIRRRLLTRFPFGLLYQVEDTRIVIIAVMHLRRRPGYWEGRQ